MEAFSQVQLAHLPHGDRCVRRHHVRLNAQKLLRSMDAARSDVHPVPGRSVPADAQMSDRATAGVVHNQCHRIARSQHVEEDRVPGDHLLLYHHDLRRRAGHHSGQYDTARFR
uniref:(northern house mosquito) hypothetical protein n=1 Tax=Culex pipiens TaxID=7175 RepID=A0A8D8DKC8_CULPI